MKKNNFHIRKDDFKRFKKCPKLMWLMRNRSNNEIKEWCFKNLHFLSKEELKKYESTFKFDFNNSKKVESELEIRIINGCNFEKIVEKHYSKLFNFFDFEKIENRFQLSFKKTKEILVNKKYNVFYHPSFKFENYVTECDLLKRNKDGFDIYEIKGKGKSGIKTDKKDLINDLLYQKWLLSKLNIKIKKCYILHINSDYLYDKKMDSNKLIKINNIYNDSEFLNKNIENDLINSNKWLNYQWNDEMKTRLLNNSFCNEEDVDFCTYIIPKSLLSKHNIIHLYKLKRKDKAKILSEKTKKEIDLFFFDESEYKFIKEKHIRQINVIKGNEKIIKNIKQAKNILNNYKYPIYFYDFETCPMAIPKFDKSNPYQQIPFQFSIHVLIDENYDLKTNHNIKHYEFITTNKKNPKLEFTKNFIKLMTKHGNGSYVAFYTPFEKSIINKLLENNYSDFTKEQTSILKKIVLNSIDLMDFFKDFNIYFKDLKGSLSIKSILPTLDSSFSYKNLKIKDGTGALINYFNYVNNLITNEEWNEIISYDLKKYCKLDSLAMVIIFDKIKKLIFNNSNNY